MNNIIGFLPDFFWRALIGGIGVAIVVGPLGTFVVWKKMAFFGDTLAHSALLGITLSLALSFPVIYGIIFVSLWVALFLSLLQKNRNLSTDTLLGIFSHGTLALGLLMVAAMQNVRIDILGYLYGDILLLTWSDVGYIYLGGFIILLMLWRIWHKLLNITVHSDLAQVEGVNIQKIRMYYMLMLAIVVSIAIKVVGVLLITALLIIPCTVSRAIMRTPESLAIGASIVGSLCVCLGLMFSFYWDLPAGPAIVCTAFLLFLVSLGLKKYQSLG